MICKPCKNRDHESCPERARQRALGQPVGVQPYPVVPTDHIGGQLCDCQHQPCQPQPSR